ncbi:MAG: DNA recombination protein RmuC [Planctomycetota bacterium]|jgi:DNA recombination protein RmuC
MIDWLDALVGLGIGLLLGGLAATVLVLVRRGRLASEVSNARARAELLDERLKAQAEDEDHLKAVFRALGAEALQANNEQFTELATATLKTVLAEASGDAEKRKQAVESLVKPVKELLEKHSLAVTEIEKKREVAYRGLEEQIKAIAASHQKLGDETNRLVAALRRPEQRGRWGEMQLRNAVEMAGMTPHCDFTEQPQTDDPATRDRPDMIVHLPGGGVIVVDAKVALDAYLDTLDADGDRDVAMQRHAGQVAEHCRRLSGKRYWDQFERTPKLVVLFMPLESALTAALDLKPDLHAEAMRQQVLIASPTLLVALLRAVAFGWQQEDLAANARQIARVGGELYGRLAKFVEHLEGVGKAINKAGGAYDDAVGSLEKRVLPSARELRELHATTEKSVEPPPTIQIETRRITASELKPTALEPSEKDAG